MTFTKDIYNFIDSIAPFSSQMGFDNAGLLIGNRDVPVKKATMALDITSQVVEEAVKNGSQLIISHHPVIFHPLKSVPSYSVTYKLIQNGLCAICAHTNWDIAVGGVNDVLCEKIGIKNPVGICETESGDICRIGQLEKSVSSKELAEITASALDFNGVTFAGGNSDIKTVAVCGGSGDEYMCKVFEKADAFITGEVKHHNFLAAYEMGKTVICAGHYATEAPAMERLKEILEKQFADIEFILTKTGNPQQAIGGK